MRVFCSGTDAERDVVRRLLPQQLRPYLDVCVLWPAKVTGGDRAAFVDISCSGKVLRIANISTDLSRHISYLRTEHHGALLEFCIGVRTNGRFCGPCKRYSDCCQRCSEIFGLFRPKNGSYLNHPPRNNFFEVCPIGLRHSI